MNKNITVDIVTRSEDLPEMDYADFFHSCDMFVIIEHTPGQRPYMAVARCGNRIVGHLLAMLRRRGAWLPPYIFTQGRVYGCGEYADGEDCEHIFSLMLAAITRKCRNKICLYIEFSDLPNKMFGYRHFRNNGYFPIHWMEIHNSLHSLAPEKRLSKKTVEKIRKAEKAGVTSEVVETHDDFMSFYKMLHSHFKLKIRRYIPACRQFIELEKNNHCRIIVTKHKQKVIGGCACVYSGENAYLWYLASKRKTHLRLYPDTMTVWAAIRYAYEHDFRHIYFMDVGLPFSRNHFRDFILRFGGKPVGTYRWFRFSFAWINRLINWIYRE